MNTKDIITYYGSIRKAADAMEVTYQHFHKIQQTELAPKNMSMDLHFLTEGRQKNGVRLRHNQELYPRGV